MPACFATPTTLVLSPTLALRRACRRTPAHPHTPFRTRARRATCAATPPSRPSPSSSDDDPAEDPPAQHDIPQSAVDWNTEWASFTQSGMRSMAPKGREPVSKTELEASRAKKRVRDVADRMPSRQQLFRDWRFWVAVIATLSLFSAFVQSSQNIGGATI